MLFRLLADAVVALHLAFVVFVALGALAVWRWPRLAWLHLPCVAWGVGIEWAGGICPLTPLENHLRRLAGGEGYAGGFLERYLIPILYPDELTRATQLALGALALLINVGIYAALIAKRRRLLVKGRDRRARP